MGLIKGDTRSSEYGVCVYCPSEHPSCRVMWREHACLSMQPNLGQGLGSKVQIKSPQLVHRVLNMVCPQNSNLNSVP